jgi:manganese-dependent inorganic pyrophosphatase
MRVPESEILQARMSKIYVIGHVNPDADSIASAMGYAWFLSCTNGDEYVAARAGPINEQTAWVLKRVDLQAPDLLADASPRFKSVTQRLDTVKPDRSLGDAWALANRTGYAAPVVDAEGLPYSLITGMSIFSYLGQMLGPHLRENDIALRDLFDRPCGEAGDKAVPRFQSGSRIRDSLPRILREERNEFWVVDETSHYVGICRQRNLLNPPRLQLILVDHNEVGQALGSLDEADLLEVLDHHRLGNPPTRLPIRFRVDIVGSTSTLVSERIESAGMSAPPELAGLLLAGLISDTLLHTSPTTTERDKKAAERLARWAFVGGSPLEGETLESYGEQVLRTGTDITTRDPLSVVKGDFKAYDAQDKKFGVAQIEVTDFVNISSQLEILGSALDKLREQEGLDFAVLMVTNIVDASSRLIFRGKVPFTDELPYRILPDGSYSAEEVVSRKKQLLPVLLALLEG